MDKKFDEKKLKKLNNPERLIMTPPDTIWESLELQNPKVAVDIGAGTGFFSIPFLEKLGSGGIIHALDISNIMVDWMKKEVQPHFPGIIPGIMEESVIPLKDNSADLVLMFYLYHELENPKQLLSEVYRVLKPGAALAIVDWKICDIKRGPPQNIRVPVSNVIKDLSSAGFKNIREDESLEMHFLVTAGV